jgi:uncharacterized protein YqjF (DUF2071 family)
MTLTLRAAPKTGARPIIVRQRWDAIAFLHWKMEPSVVQAVVPDGLEVETFEGSAWVGIVPFRNIVTPPLVSVPRWTYLEVNVRTYVRGADGTSGIFFFAFDVPYVWMVAGARALLGARYELAATDVRTNGDAIRYRSVRTGRRGSMDIVVRPGERIASSNETDLDRFLTDRFCLFSASPVGILRVDVPHTPWRLRTASASLVGQDLLSAAGLPTPDIAPLVHAADPITDARVLLPRPANRWRREAPCTRCTARSPRT